MSVGRTLAEYLATHRRRELLWFGVVGGFGLFVLPLLIYAAGSRTLGPYEGGGLLTFLGVLYGDFVRLHPAAWALMLGPYALFMGLRLITRPLRSRISRATEAAGEAVPARPEA
jgi:hypothetical protein